MDLTKILHTSAAGMHVQGERMRIVAENLANAGSAANTPDAEPYRRKLITFSNELDRELGVQLVEVAKVTFDKSEFGRKYDPGHPGANDQGYVLTPNVNSLIEMTDMREAQRGYEANLSIISVAKDMLKRTIDILN
ncbi:MAG: flagellar basal body rod protein FlgC [Rhodospirillaceae bacterium]|jgi:flagellar basal-body rod protein FlgC|nr:flagellar basal body rod protein FlgC [Rhodospirillaceae bacterium]MBT3627264.1 flagellar basal body rod protein FlgC [Rhodospirillaceae bacterium]MBT3928920.1 flagellar basal body rod protein FlgC [Rhodospirillaceae bacterium]MBT4426296.1 flagellar basal body rod protein FlgC [Rhodospirillaceae bacterium]MBT5039123.1 flagellar basal body rod protein FlgC [Rhodospirillaceae bacterium]